MAPDGQTGAEAREEGHRGVETDGLDAPEEEGKDHCVLTNDEADDREHADSRGRRVAGEACSVYRRSPIRSSIGKQPALTGHPDGVLRATVCSYDKGSAEDRKERLEASGCSSVKSSETKPGQLLQPQA